MSKHHIVIKDGIVTESFPVYDDPNADRIAKLSGKIDELKRQSFEGGYAERMKLEDFHAQACQTVKLPEKEAKAAVGKPWPAK